LKHALALAPGIPYPDGGVLATCHDQRLSWMPIAGRQLGVMLFEKSLLLGGGEVPHLGRAIV
jgi:hypothetical protein